MSSKSSPTGRKNNNSKTGKKYTPDTIHVSENDISYEITYTKVKFISEAEYIANQSAIEKCLNAKSRH